MDTAAPIIPRPQAIADTAFAEKFLERRHRLIGYLVKLNNAVEHGLADLSQALLGRFCDTLMDYLCASQLHVFRRLAAPPRSQALVAVTTEAGLTFYDRYAEARAVRLTELKDALEHAVRVLCARFELEDELLETNSR